MEMNLFSQFNPPIFLGLSLLLPSLIVPFILLPKPSKHWMKNRLLTLYTWFTMTFLKQIFQPMNVKGHTWTFLLFTLMMFLLTINLLGLLPYTFTPTTQPLLNMTLAVPLWFATVVAGLRNSITKTLSHLLPENTPPLLVPILIIIETISFLIRPVALGVRLTANLIAGHLLMLLVSTATFFLITYLPLTAIVTTVLLFCLMLLETAVSIIQAYVFILLLSLYLQENL